MCEFITLDMFLLNNSSLRTTDAAPSSISTNNTRPEDIAILIDNYTFTDNDEDTLNALLDSIALDKTSKILQRNLIQNHNGIVLKRF